MKTAHFTKILYFIISILLFLDIFLLFDRNQQKHTKPDNHEIYNLSDRKYITERFNENIKPGSHLKVISTNGDSLNIWQLVKQKKIVFRYTINNCSDCVTKEFEVIRKALLDNPLLQERLIIMTFYNNNSAKADDFRELRNRKIKLPIYICKQISGIPLEEENIPYYFVLNEDQGISNVFICQKEKPDLTIAYLKSTYNFCTR